MKTKLIILFTLISMTIFGQGFYSKQVDPQGKYISATIVSDTNHYSILYAETGVEGGLWRLDIDNKNTYTYPVHGWYLAETEHQAIDLLGLKKELKEEESPQ